MANKVIDAVVRLAADKASLSQLQRGFKSFRESVRDVENALDSVEMSLNDISSIGAELSSVGQSVLSPFQNLSQTYIDMVGRTEVASIRWAKSMGEVTQAQVRMGRAATTALQPMQDQLVRLTNTAADFVEKHPELLRTVTGAGGIALAAGTALTVVSQVGTQISTVMRQLNSMKSMLGPLGKLGSVAGAAGVLAAGYKFGPEFGLQLARVFAEFLEDSPFAEWIDAAAVSSQDFEDVLNTLSKTVELAIDGWILAFAKLADALEQARKGVREFWLDLRKRFMSDEEYESKHAEILNDYNDAVKEIWQSANDFAGEVNDLRIVFDERIASTQRGRGLPGGGGAGAASGGPIITEDMLRQFEDFLYEQEIEQERFRRQVEQETEDFNRQQELNLEEHHRQQALMEEDFQIEQREQREQFNRDIADMERDYAYDRHVALEDFQIEMARTEDEFRRSEAQRVKDFQLEETRAAKDHRDSLRDAAARLDAVSVLDQQRQYTKDRMRAQQDFDRETKLNREQYDRELALAQEQFDRQEELAKEAYDRQRADMERNFRLQERLQRENFNRQIKRMNEEFDYRAQLEQREFEYRMAVENRNFNYEQQLNAERFRRQMELELRVWTWEEQTLAAHYANLQTLFNAFIQGSTRTMTTAVTAAQSSPTRTTSSPTTGTAYRQSAYQRSAEWIASVNSKSVKGSYAGGTDYVPSTGLYMLHRGERVVPQGAGMGGMQINMPISITGRNGGNDRELVAQFRQVVRTELTVVMKEFARNRAKGT